MCVEWDVSIRRSCRVLEFETSTYHYKARRRDQAHEEKRIKEICQARVRYGYRRVHGMLRREGFVINAKRTRLIYRELGLQLRNKTPKRRVKAKLRDDRKVATMPNETWAMDFVHDQLATGRKLRILTVVDTYSKYSPAIDPRFTYKAEDVVRTLEGVCKREGYPTSIRVDRARSSSHAISTCGPMRIMWFWTSRDQANPQTMRSLKASTAAFAPNV